MSPNAFLSAILQAATRHGLDDDSDHEIGDLQQFAWALWRAMSPSARKRIMSDDTWTDFLATWGTK